METIGGYQLVREIGGWETRWFIYTAYKLDDPKKTEVVLKTCQVNDLPPNPSGIPATIPAFLVAANHQREAAAQVKGIAPIFDSGVEDGRVFCAMPRYTFSIERLIKNKLLVSDDALEELAENIFDCLERLRKARNHSHGNIKPSNVFLAGNVSLSKAQIVLADLSPDIQSRTLAGDIHAVGHLLHQLIRRRELAESFYPLQRTEEWDDLGGDAQKWIHCINRFLDPALDKAEDPLKIARAALKNSGRESAGGTMRQGAKAIKQVGSSKTVQSSIWIGLFLALAGGALFFARHQLTNADAAWKDVQTKNHAWLGSIVPELSNPQTAALWKEAANPQLNLVTDKITNFLEKSPATVAFVVNSPNLPTYDAVKSKDDAYRLQGDKSDPGKVSQLGSDLERIRSGLNNYLPPNDKDRLQKLQNHLAAAKWPIPDSLARAVTFDANKESELGAAISRTLPLAPLLLTENRLDLLDHLASKSAQILPIPDPLLQAYLDGIREKVSLLFHEPIDSQIWNNDASDLWPTLKRRDNGLAEILEFLQGKIDRIAYDRLQNDTAASDSPLRVDQPDFPKRWTSAAAQYMAFENPDAIRQTWTAEWMEKSKKRSGTEELNKEIQTLIAQPKPVKLDQAKFDEILAQLEFYELAEPVVAATPSPNESTTTPSNLAESTQAKAGYQTLLQKYLAQVRTSAAGNIAAVTNQFRTECAAFTSLPGVQDFLDQLTINLTKTSSGWRPKGFPAASRPNPADPLLFNIPLPGRGAFPFRLITPASGTPFFLGVWEVPIALLSPADFDTARADGPRFWNVVGGKTVALSNPTWPQLQTEMIGKTGPVAPYIAPQAATVPGGPQNWQRLPANFVSPTAAVRVATAFGLRLPTIEEWKAAYAVANNASDGWLRGKAWKDQVNYIIETVGARLQESYREGVAPTYPAVFPTTRAYGSFDVSQKEDFDPTATQASLYFRPTFTATNPDRIKDMRGNVSEIVTNGGRFSVIGPSSLSSPKFTGMEGAPSIIPAGVSFSDVGFRFAVDAMTDSGTSNIPQLFADELQRVSR